MPLSKLVNGDENSSLLMLTDSLHHPAVCLLKARLKGLVNNLSYVHLMLFELRKDQLLRGLAPGISKKIEIHDFTTDPFGWVDSTRKAYDDELPTFPLLPKDERCAVVIDSLSSLILSSSPQRVCRWLSSFLRLYEHCQVTAVVHKDLHSDAVVRTLEYISNVIVRMHSTESSTCTVVRKFHGKLPKITTETFSVNEDFVVRSSEIVEKDNSDLTPPKKAQANPASNLTFNLGISKTESEARSKVKLPYVQTSDVASKQIDAALSSLDVDDIEDDPDDDLDI